jgi:hypothetical protein
LKKLAIIATGVFAICLFGNAQQWVELDMHKAHEYYFYSSSELASSDVNNTYRAINLIDGNTSTAWVEGEKDDGKGQSIVLSVPLRCKSINIVNGYAKSATLFQKNNRVKTINLSYCIGINPDGYASETAYNFFMYKHDVSHKIDLADISDVQSFSFWLSPNEQSEILLEAIKNFDKTFNLAISSVIPFIEITIESTYKGTKYDDTCISEIFFNDSFVSNIHPAINSNIVNVYTDESETKLLFDTPTEKALTLINNPESVYQILEVSDENDWVIIAEMPNEPFDGRVETQYLIVNVKLGLVMNSHLEKTAGSNLYGPFYLIKKGDEIYLEHSQGEIWLR